MAKDIAIVHHPDRRTDVTEQDDLNRVWGECLRGHLPTTTTVEVSRLATHARCKLEISAIAVAEDA
jgi:enamine deaminase RidA (YjgF/YER057c/UK114 family)